MSPNEPLQYPPWLERVLHCAPLGILAGVAVSLMVGILQIVYMNRRQREQTARAIFSDFIKLSIEHPTFAFPERFRERYNYQDQTINIGSDKDKNIEEFEKYEWYISALLIACREVLETLSSDQYWKHRVNRNLGYHIDYIIWRERLNKQDDFVLNSGKKVRRVIEDLKRDYDRKKRKS